MSNAITECRVFRSSTTLKRNADLTLAEKNAVLEQFVAVLCAGLDMVVFDELTDEDETYGNSYYIGYENASHASLCIYFPHRDVGNYFQLALAFVNDNNTVMDPGGNPRYYGYDQNWVWTDLRTNNYNILYYFSLTTTRFDTGTYINCFMHTGIDNEATAQQRAMDLKNYKNCHMFFPKNTNQLPYLMKHYQNYGLRVLNCPASKGSNYPFYINKTDQNSYLYYLTDLNPNKKYFMISRIRLVNCDDINNQDYWFELDDRFKFIWMVDSYLYSRFPCRIGGIVKIDNKYYLSLTLSGEDSTSYNWPIIVYEIGDSYEKVLV